MSTLQGFAHRLRDEELHLLQKLRLKRRETLADLKPARDKPPLTLGPRIADLVAASVGSWPFIIIQSAVLLLWMMLNVVGWVKAWDPYPFILLNLVLSFQAAYAAPFIMMSQNRQADLDRTDARHDYEVNVRAELEIELLHQKIDLLRETEIIELIKTIKALEERLSVLTPNAAPASG